MTLDDIIALTRAGYTKDDITALITPAAQPEPAPAPEPEPTPAPEPAPVSVGVAEQYDPAGLESLLKEVLGGVRKSVDDLRSTVQASQVLTGVQAAPENREDALRTAAEHAAGIFRPVQNK